MCGRFSLAAKPEDLENIIPKKKVSSRKNLAKRYNIAPTQQINAVVNDHTLELLNFKWGLIPSWSKDDSLASKMINARSETIFEKPSFRNLILKRRCLIPATGYYEWKLDSESKRKIPYYIKSNKDELLTFAGLWDSWRNKDNQIIRSATIITCEPNDKLSFVHNRMPVIINPEHREKWLSNELLKESIIELLVSVDSAFIDFYQVEDKVNSPSFDSEECIYKKNV